MDAGPYPVMVWYYGGSFQIGGNRGYHGYFLAARDVIVVVPNYRLDNLGMAVMCKLNTNIRVSTSKCHHVPFRLLS